MESLGWIIGKTITLFLLNPTVEGTCSKHTKQTVTTGKSITFIN